MSNLKILHINTKLQGGGVATIANSIHKYINENTDYESTFLYGRGKISEENTFKITNNLDVYVSGLATRFLGRGVNLYFSEEIESFIAESDVIHIHNLHGYYLNYKKLIELIVKYNKAVVWSLQDTWSITGRCAIPTECEEWRNGCKKCLNKNIYPKTYNDIAHKLWIEKKNIFNKLPKDKTVLVSPSKWFADHVNKSFLKNYKTLIIPNGVKNEYSNCKDKRELRKKLSLPLDKDIILFVADNPNDRNKGIQFILEIMDKFNDNILFLSMGKKIENINSKKLMQFGYVSDRKLINEVYRACDLFVIPSLGDNFPTTVLEAFSNGVPVVGFDVGGIPEQLDNACGIVVKKANVVEFMDGIKRLMDNKQLRDEMSKNCIEKFEREYDFKIFAERYIKIYEEVSQL